MAYRGLCIIVTRLIIGLLQSSGQGKFSSIKEMPIVNDSTGFV